MQAVKRPYTALAQHDTAPHHHREYSSRTAADTRPQRQHSVTKGATLNHIIQDMDLEDADLEDATAVGALLALQNPTHSVQPSQAVRSASLFTELELLAGRRGSSKLPTVEPAERQPPVSFCPVYDAQAITNVLASSFEIAAAHANLSDAARASAAFAWQEGAALDAGPMKVEDGDASHIAIFQLQGTGGKRSSFLPGSSSGCPRRSMEEEHLDCERRQKSGMSNSCGSAKDTFVAGASQDLDMLEDMEVTVVSETEKGCQVWFPPLPEEIERLQKSMGSQQCKRKLPGLPQEAAGAEDGDTGTCSTGNNDDDADLAMHASGRAGPRESAEAAANRANDSKRQRFIWTNELHERFVAAVQHLGVKTAVPKAILQIMKVEGMTRENVASHLQKFRMALRRMDMQSGNNGSTPMSRCLSQEDMAMLAHTHRFGSGVQLPGGSRQDQDAANRQLAAHKMLLLDEATNSLKQRQPSAQFAADFAPAAVAVGAVSIPSGFLPLCYTLPHQAAVVAGCTRAD